MSIEKKVWDTLSAVDVSGFVERKQNLSYLSWAHAYSMLCQHFPANSYEFYETWLPDNTVMVECRLTIREGDESMTRMGWLPVMDYRNKAIASPDAFAINTTRMRCLTKTLSLATGLGMSLYAGQDLPMASVLARDEAITDEQCNRITSLIESTETDLGRFCKAYKISQVSELAQGQFEHAKSTLERKLAKMEAE